MTNTSGIVRCRFPPNIAKAALAGASCWAQAARESVADVGLGDCRAAVTARRSSMRVDTLTGYMLLFPTAQLFYALAWRRHTEIINLALSVAAVAFSSHPAVMLLAHMGCVLRSLWMTPNIFNSEIWGMIMDVGVILTTLATIGLRNVAAPMTSAAARDALAREIMAVMRNALVWFYLGAGIWKINWGFLDTQGSCAPIYLLQLVDAFVPQGLMPPMALLQLLGDAAPALVILVEAGIGVLMHLPGRSCPRLGVALGVLLHGLIAITPSPNNAGGFGVMLLVRYYAFVPEATAEAFGELTDLVRRHGASIGIGGAGLCAACLPGLRAPGPVDWSIPIYAAQALLLARALVLEARRAAPRPATPPLRAGASRIVRGGLAGWMVLYTFGLPMLGLQDMGNVHMFASLRLHGGSNHLFLPTGLLQRWLHDAPPASPWAGGVVRVDYTSSPHMAGTYPGEVTHVLTPSVRALLRACGHTGRQWFPLKTRIFGPQAHPVDVLGPPLPYTIPALELRRLIAEARRLGETNYTLVYTRLPEGRLDVPSSRAPHGGPTVTFSVDADGRERCVVGGQQPNGLLGALGVATACEPTELPLLPEPGLWPLKLSLFYPVPLLPADAGPSVEMPCVDP